MTNSPAKRGNEWRAWTPYFVLATTLLFTVIAMSYVARESEARDKLRFENSVRHIHESIQYRIGTYVTMLRAGASLFAASENVTREEFRIYVERLELQSGNAGIRGIGYSTRISSQEKDALISSMRAGGVKDFKIWPENPVRDEYHSIIYLEPLDERNLRAFGYDMSMEPVRRAAMEQARDSGEPTASGRVTLIQELEDLKQAGFLIYVPVYRDGAIPATEAERREKLMGFIYAPFRVGDLLNGIFGSEKSHEAGFELFDGAALNSDSLLYNSEPAQPNNSYRPRFTARTPMPIAGRTWTLAFATQPQFDEQSGRNLLPYILLVGGLLSLVLFGITRREVKARTIAERAANELRRSELLLRESESRLRRLADANIIGITIGDIHGHVLEANDAFLDIIGYARGELESGKVDWMELTPQEFRHLDQSAMQEMQQSGKHAPFEKEFVRKDGTRVSVLVGTAYLGGANELTVSFILDLTRRRSAEKVLLETEQRAVKEYERLLVRITALAQALGTARDLQAIFHALREFAIASVPSIGIFLSLYDPEREVRIAAYGWEGAEVDVSQLPPMPISKDGPNSRAVRTGQVVITDDYMALMRGHPTVTVGEDNGLMPQSSLVAPMAVMGRIVGTIEVQSHELAAYREEHVTAMRMAANLAAVAIENVQLFERESRARAAAEEASRMKDEFLATVSHELRTPLTSMLGWTYMLRSGELDEPTRLRAIETIERNVRLQAQIVDDILDVSRIITGKLRMDVQPVELTALIENAINAVRPAVLAKEIEIETRLEAGTHPVSGDANRLQQVFWNVFSNAVKFTPREGSVKIHMQRTGSHVEIRVTDTGLGIRKEFLPYVFDRFRQADSSTTRTYGGLGLGLAIVRHLVEMHGGTVQAESPGEGLGATFILTLPLASARTTNEAGEIEQAATGERVSASLEGLHVLIVDDEPDTCEMLKMMLEGNAAKVTTAMSAREALAAIESRRPDILISDIAMPNEDGYDLIRKLRLQETEQGTHLPAIALTAYAREEDRARSLAQGYQAFLTKPVEPSELVSLVAHVAAEGEKSNGRAEQS